MISTSLLLDAVSGWSPCRSAHRRKGVRQCGFFCVIVSSLYQRISPHIGHKQMDARQCEFFRGAFFDLLVET